MKATRCALSARTDRGPTASGTASSGTSIAIPSAAVGRREPRNQPPSRVRAASGRAPTITRRPRVAGLEPRAPRPGCRSRGWRRLRRGRIMMLLLLRREAARFPEKARVLEPTSVRGRARRSSPAIRRSYFGERPVRLLDGTPAELNVNATFLADTPTSAAPRLVVRHMEHALERTPIEAGRVRRRHRPFAPFAVAAASGAAVPVHRGTMNIISVMRVLLLCLLRHGASWRVHLLLGLDADRLRREHLLGPGELLLVGEHGAELR